MKKTAYDSYLYGKLAKGCKLCVKGRKMVLFVTGLCSRNCNFCPLSNKRKSKEVVYSNERKISKYEEIVEEVKNSHAKGCSLTGGDPLLKLEKTLKFAENLKKSFGKNFHIHIYLSTKLVNLEKLKKLSRVVDEVRFHPDLELDIEKEAEKIKLAKFFWNKKDIGIELPMFPDKIKEIYNLIKKTSKFISFLNLNQLESGEYSEDYLRKKYSFDEEGYTIKDSIKSGKILMKKLELKFPKLNVHLCTARLKNWHQYRNRLKNYKLPKFFKKTDEGTRIYFTTTNKKEIKKNISKNNFYIDKRKRIVILNPKIISKLNVPIYKIEEYPTFDRDEAEIERIK